MFKREIPIRITVGSVDINHIAKAVDKMDAKKQRKKDRFLALLDDKDVQAKIIKIAADSVRDRTELHAAIIPLLD